MQIYADLEAFERYLDFFEQEEKTVCALIELLREKQNTFSEVTPELQVFFEKQLRFLSDEKRRIRLRHTFMEDTYNDIRYAKKELEDSLATASGIITLDNS